MDQLLLLYHLLAMFVLLRSKDMEGIGLASEVEVVQLHEFVITKLLETEGLLSNGFIPLKVVDES